MLPYAVCDDVAMNELWHPADISPYFTKTFLFLQSINLEVTRVTLNCFDLMTYGKGCGNVSPRQ